MSEPLRAATAMSRLANPQEAGCEAARGAVAALGQMPSLVMVAAPFNYEPTAMLKGIRTEIGDAIVVGASTAGHFAQGAYQTAGSGIAVCAMTAGPYRFGGAWVGSISQDMRAAGHEVARRAAGAVQGGLGPASAVLVVSDGLASAQHDLLTGIYSVGGAAVPVVGGCAADDLGRQATRVYFGGPEEDVAASDAAVALWITGDAVPRPVAGHGWTPNGIPWMVTRSEGNRLIQVSARPAAEFYRRAVGNSTGSWEVEELLTRPLGMVQPDGTLVVRAVRSVCDDGSLELAGAVPVGTAIQVLHGTKEDLLAGSKDAISRALATVESPGVLLGFSCVARSALFGDQTFREVDAIQGCAGEVPTFGFYTFGEFARTRAVVGFHNASFTAIGL